MADDLQKEYQDYKDYQDYQKYVNSTKGASPQAPSVVAKPLNTPSQAQAGLESFGQGAAMGYLPQLQAVSTKAVDALTPEPQVDKDLIARGFLVQPKEQSYTELRDQNIARQDAEAKEFPKTTAAGSLAGTIAAAPLYGKVLPGSVATTAKGKIAEAAAGGALMGIAQNPGDTKGEVNLAQLADRSRMGSVGAITGGLFQGGVNTVSAAAQKLKDVAETKAFKSGGAMLKDFRKAYGKGKVNEYGRTMLDQGVVAAGDKVDDIAQKALDLKDLTGKRIGSIYDSIKEAIGLGGQKSSAIDLIVSPETMKAELKAAVSDPRVIPKLNTKAYSDSMDSYIEQISGSGKLHDIRYLNDVIGEIDSKINWAKRTPELSDQQAGLVKMRNTLRNKVNQVAQAMGEAIGNPQVAEDLKKYNKLYGTMAEVSRIAEDRIARNQANRAFSPSDYGMALGGGVIGAMTGGDAESRVEHGLLGAGLGMANHVGRVYGNPVLAIGADKAANVLNKAGLLNPYLSGAASAGMERDITGGSRR